MCPEHLSAGAASDPIPPSSELLLSSVSEVDLFPYLLRRDLLIVFAVEIEGTHLHILPLLE